MKRRAVRFAYALFAIPAILIMAVLFAIGLALVAIEDAFDR